MRNNNSRIERTGCAVTHFYIHTDAKLNLRLATREKAQQPIDAGVQEHVHDERDHDWQRQRVAAFGGRARHNPPERRVQRVCHAKDELRESCAPAGSEERENEPDREQRIDDVEDIIK